MGAASTLRRKGFVKNLADTGETVTYSGTSQTFTAIVSYLQEPKLEDLEKFLSWGSPQNSDRTQSVVECLQTSLSSAPEIGQGFTNADGRKHRITKRPRTTDFTYVCICEVSSPFSEESS